MGFYELKIKNGSICEPLMGRDLDLLGQQLEASPFQSGFAANLVTYPNRP
jgi:hypothetical protein